MKILVIPDDWGQEHNLGLYEETFDAAIRFQRAYPDRSQMVITSADLEACPPEELTDVVS